MKILIYTHPFAPTVGGAESYAMLLAQGLSALSGFDSLDVVVATATPAGDFDDSNLAFQVVRQPNLRALVRLIMEADVVQLVGPCLVPLLIGWLLRKPVVIEHHGYPPVCPNGLLFYEPTKTVCPGHFLAHRYHECLRCNASNVGWLNSFKMLVLTFPRRWLCQRVAVNTPITVHVQNRLKLPRSQVVYYGIPETQTDRDLSLIHATSASPLCFAYVGRLVSLKGLPLILEAAKNLQMQGYSFHLKFVGDGPERGRLEWLTQELGLAQFVEFTGFITGRAFQITMRKVAAVLMPSIWEETAGLAAMEQMMRGRLVIASDIGGLGEVVDDCGLRFSPGSAEQLAQCMRTVLDNPEIVELKGDAARRRASACFPHSRMISEHLVLYRLVTNSTERGKKAKHQVPAP